jgi:hypothetical protein
VSDRICVTLTVREARLLGRAGRMLAHGLQWFFPKPTRDTRALADAIAKVEDLLEEATMGRSSFIDRREHRTEHNRVLRKGEPE